MADLWVPRSQARRHPTASIERIKRIGKEVAIETRGGDQAARRTRSLAPPFSVVAVVGE